MVRGLGVDLVEIERVKGVVKRREETFYNRIFTEKEIIYCKSKPSPVTSLAGRFAAKEAVFKALGVKPGKCRWKEIEIIVNKVGRPGVVLYGKAKVLAGKNGIKEISLSISHSRDYAVAFAVAL